MKELQYKDFSLRTHKGNLRLNRPNVCQFELTFKCDLHCLHCYTDCYNNPSYLKNELSTNEVKAILDKVYKAGCLWLCFTGGDPLKREDFLEIYSYAKHKGLITTIFTNGYSLTKKIANFLKESPPFTVEITLNAVTKKTFEEISRLPDSFEKTLRGISMLTEHKIPFKIKTMVLKNNIEEMPKIEEFVKNLGLEFMPSAFINARLNKDTFPCSLRVSPSRIFNNNEVEISNSKEEEGKDCSYGQQNGNSKNQSQKTSIFNCAVASRDSIYISPYGRMVFCNCLREPSIDLLKQDIKETSVGLFPRVMGMTFTKDSPCQSCDIRYLCRGCPGRAFLEKGDMESPLEWFCQMAYLASSRLVRLARLGRYEDKEI